MKNQLSFVVVFRTLLRLAALNAVFLLLMSLFRLVFFLYYGDLSSLDGMGRYVFRAFSLGVRYDLAVIAYVNTLVTLSLIVVWAARSRKAFSGWLTALKIYYPVMFFTVFAVLFVDFGFYSYFKSHLNILIFGIFEDDTKALFSTLAANYNIPLVVMGFAALFFLIFFIVRLFIRPLSERDELPFMNVPLIGNIVLAVALVTLNVAAARGSFSLFPLGTLNAEISPDIFINKVSLNGVYTLQEALEYRLRENRGYDLTDKAGYKGRAEEAFADFLGLQKSALPANLTDGLNRRTRPNPAAERLRPNVVVIMMEGFGSDLLRYDSDRFNVTGALKKHFDEDIVFYNFLSGDVGTIGSIETVVMNIPKRPMAKAITQSRFAYNAYPSGAAVPYKSAGYETVFLYGGNAAWRDLQSFAPKLGFDTVEGEGAMDPSYPRNEWGVYDEFLFDHLYKKLSADPGRPKFIFAMSTTNHPPYSLPPGYKKFPLEIDGAFRSKITGDLKLARGRFETYQYANDRLGELITRIKSSPLGKNTIIAVTGDHNFWSVFDYPAERFADQDGVPFYLYVPEALKPAKVDREVFGSHVDIMPTLYNLSLSNAEYTAFGSDLLDGSISHAASNVDGLLFTKDAAARLIVDNGAVSYYRWDPKARLLVPAQETEKHREMIKRYKAELAVTEYYLREKK